MVISTVRLIAQDFTQAYYYEPSVLGYKKTKVKSKMGIYAKPFKSNVSTMQYFSLIIRGRQSFFKVNVDTFTFLLNC